jgi:sulfatase maturation enzyme AslB (radical SAM superfamily)
MTPQQLVIVWRVYEPCNLGCRFCGYSHEIARKRHIVSPDSILKFGKVLSEFQQRTGKEVLVSWLGGEPLLWKDLPAISIAYDREFAIKLGITTNGTMLDKEHVRRLLIDHYSLVTVSIDGFASFHDAQRGENGLFDKLKKHVSLLVKEIPACNSSLRLRINTILMRENIHAFEAFCMEIAGWGIQELTFNQLGGIDRPEFYPDNRLLPEQAIWLAQELPTLQRNALAKGLKVFGTKQYVERISGASQNIAISIADCSPGTQFLFINEANQVSPCNFTSESYGIPLTQIEDIHSLINLAERFRYKQVHERAAQCNNCMSTQVFEKFN